MCIDFWFRAALRVSHPDSPVPIRSLKRDVSASNRYSPETKCNVSLLVFVKRIFIKKLIFVHAMPFRTFEQTVSENAWQYIGQIWLIINLCMPISCLLLIPILLPLKFCHLQLLLFSEPTIMCVVIRGALAKKSCDWVVRNLQAATD